MPPKDTLNTNYLKFKESLPKNLRLTPEKDYHMYDYWRLSGEPENFREGKRRGMFTWDRSDKGYHAGSIAEDRNTGIYHFMKPKHHPTVKYELDWFNKGLQTLEGGKQVPVEGKDKEFWEDFTSKYQLDTTGVDYRYVPIKKKGGNIHIKKKNRGKFTEYCGGKVTEECIRKGKNSSNPAVRKRATFAANARKWKHKNGGQMIPNIIKFFNGGGISMFQNSGKLGSNPLYPRYGSHSYAKFAYERGDRNPEAIGAALPDRLNEDVNINGTSFSTITNDNGKSTTDFKSDYTLSYDDGTYNTIQIENSNNNGEVKSYQHSSFGMPNGDRYHIYNNNGSLSNYYEVNYVKALGMDKLPKPK